MVFTDKNNSGNIGNTEILGETHYYPFGKTFEGAWYNDATAGKYRYLYNGKELSEEFDLNFYDYGARWLDPGMGSWWEVDPLAEKYYHDSPYVYAGNNPIVNIDPNGMDWYKTTDGTMQYDPNIKSKKDVGEGQSYVGRTYNDKTDNGSVNYRKDGSIMYSDQTDAYNRIASNSTVGTTHEESAAILKNGVLVLPSYDNNSTTADPGKYGYKFEGGNLVDAVDGKTKELVAMVHTHPDKGGSASPSKYSVGGPTDAKFQAKYIPGKMGYVFGHDNGLYGMVAFRDQNGILNARIYKPADLNNAKVTDVLKYKRIDLRYHGSQFKYISPR